MKKTWSNTWAIAQKELKQYFISPIGYVVMMIFLTVSGYVFHVATAQFSAQYRYAKTLVQVYRNPEFLANFNLNEWVIRPALSNMIVIFLFILPLLMMRSLAEEKRQKTDELLMTSPLTVNQILGGKYLAALFFVLILLLPTVAYQVLLFKFASPEWGPVATGYLGVFLFAAGGIAIGLFASSLTENQIIAAVVSFVILLAMFIIRGVAGEREGGIFFEIVRYLSVQEHMENMLKGLIDTRDLVYFGTIIVLFSFLTKRSVESVRWRT